jgi:hypothetical protein
MRKYSTVFASANEFGGMMQIAVLRSTKERESKCFGSTTCAVDVGEDLEFVGDADVVAVGRQSVRHDTIADLAILERARSSVLEGHLPDPAVGLN